MELNKSKWVYINKNYVFDYFNDIKNNCEKIKIMIDNSKALCFNVKAINNGKLKNYGIANPFTNTIKLFILEDLEYTIYNYNTKETTKIKGKDIFNVIPKQALENNDMYIQNKGNAQ